MAFFAESTYEESYQDLGIVVNDYTDFDALTLEACTTIQEMDNAIMQGIGKYELAQVREGAEVVYTEGMMDTIKSKLEKIWNFIKNWIKNVWNKFIAWLESYVRGDKAFLSKYKKKLDENLVYLDKDFDKTYKYAKIILNDIGEFEGVAKECDKIFNDAMATFKSIQFSDKDVSEKCSNILEKIDDDVDDIKDKFKDTDLEIDVNANWIRSNFSSIIKMVDTDVSKVKRVMDKEVKKSENNYKESIKIVQGKLKNLDQPEKSTASTSLNCLKSISTKSGNISMWCTSYIIKCIKGAKSDARSMCRAILTANPNPKYNESAFDHNDFEAYFNI